MPTPKTHPGSLAASIALLALVLACTSCSNPPPPAGSSGGGTATSECPDLTGAWRSGEYVALSVDPDGNHRELTGLTMTLEVKEQTGCLFSATNTWSNGDLDGSEYTAGVLNPDGNWITLIEVGEHPGGGSTGHILGRLIEGDQMTLEYTAYSNDGSLATAFSTIVAREGSPVPSENCPDLLGTWTGHPFDTLNVYADGSTSQQMGSSNVLTIEHQLGCTFRAVNTWSNAGLGIGGSEHVAGVLHSDGVLISMVEIGPHPEGGTRAFIRGRLIGDQVLEWDYVGITEDATMGQGIRTRLVREGEPSPREDCPDLTGKWSIDAWDGLRVHADGTHDPVRSDFHDFEIREQIGCTLMATSTYAPLDGEGDEWTENWVGVVSEQDLLIMRAVAQPSDHLASKLFARIDSERELHAEYSGYAVDGSSALVYLQHLVKE